MNEALIFVIRLIIGLICGIFLTRLFHPEWGTVKGALLGLFLVALVYGIKLFKRKPS